MRRFLVTIGAVGALVVSLVVMLATLVFPRISFEISDLVQFQNRVQQDIADAGSRPRLFLIGGSNLASGIDDELLGEVLGGRYAIVNLGHNAGLGVGPLLEIIAPVMRKEDCVVFAVEYTNLSRWGGSAVSIAYQCDVCGGNLLTIGRGAYNAYPWFGLKYYVQQKFVKLVTMMFQKSRSETKIGEGGAGTVP